MNFYFHFLKFGVIAVVSTEVEHDVVSTLLYVYAYLYESWFIFTFKVAVLPVIDCWDMDRLAQICKYICISKSAISHTHTHTHIRKHTHTQIQTYICKYYKDVKNKEHKLCNDLWVFIFRYTTSY